MDIGTAVLSPDSLGGRCKNVLWEVIIPFYLTQIYFDNSLLKAYESGVHHFILLVQQ
jgi:hypothetical protein